MDNTSLFVTTSNDFVLSDTIEEIFEVEEDIINNIKKLNDFDYVIYIKDKFRKLVYDKMMKLKKIIIEKYNDIFIISLNKSQNYAVPRLTVLVHKKMSNRAVQSVINKYISDDIVYSCSELITNYESKNTKIVLLNLNYYKDYSETTIEGRFIRSVLNESPFRLDYTDLNGKEHYFKIRMYNKDEHLKIRFI